MYCSWGHQFSQIVLGKPLKFLLAKTTQLRAQIFDMQHYLKVLYQDYSYDDTCVVQILERKTFKYLLGPNLMVQIVLRYLVRSIVLWSFTKIFQMISIGWKFAPSLYKEKPFKLFLAKTTWRKSLRYIMCCLVLRSSPEMFKFIPLRSKLDPTVGFTCFTQIILEKPFNIFFGQNHMNQSLERKL